MKAAYFIFKMGSLICWVALFLYASRLGSDAMSAFWYGTGVFVFSGIGDFMWENK